MDADSQLLESLRALDMRLAVMIGTDAFGRYAIARVQGRITDTLFELDEIDMAEGTQPEEWARTFAHLQERMRSLKEAFLLAPEPPEGSAAMTAHMHLVLAFIDAASQHLTLAGEAHKGYRASYVKE